MASHGRLAVGGIASLLFGSLMLIDSPLPELQIGLGLIVPMGGALAGIILFLVGLGLKAQKHPSVTGASGMLHAPGQARTSIHPGGVAPCGAQRESSSA